MQYNYRKPNSEYSGGSFLIFRVAIKVLSRQYQANNVGEDYE